MGVQAFSRSGRFSVMVAMRSDTSNWICSYVMRRVPSKFQGLDGEGRCAWLRSTERSVIQQEDSSARPENPNMPGRVIEEIAELKEFLGREVGTSDWFEVTQALIDAFAERDPGPSVDSRRQRACPGRITLRHHDRARLPHPFAPQPLARPGGRDPGRVRAEDQLRIQPACAFPRPFPAGARIRAHSTLQAFEEIPGGVQLTWAVVLEIEGQSRPALAAEWLVRFYDDRQPIRVPSIGQASRIASHRPTGRRRESLKNRLHRLCLGGRWDAGCTGLPPRSTGG